MMKRYLCLFLLWTFFQPCLYAQRLPSYPALSGAEVDPAADLFWIYDVSEEESAKISLAEILNSTAFTNGNFLAAAAVEFAQVSGLTNDLAAKAPLASPAFTGTPTAPTAALGVSSTQVATTAFVTAAAGYVDSAGYMLTADSDCASEFQAAVNAAAATNHKTLLIRAGTYHFASTVTVPADVTVTGEAVGDRGGYTPWPVYPFKTKLIFDGTANAIAVPITTACTLKNFELSSSNTSLTPGTVGAGIFCVNTSIAGGVTSYAGYPEFAGNHFTVENVYVHDFNENICVAYQSGWNIRKSNFTGARVWNIRCGNDSATTGTGKSGGDGLIEDCFIGGRAADGVTEAPGGGIYYRAGTGRIKNTWIYGTVSAAYFYGSQINWEHIEIEDIRTASDAVIICKDSTQLNLIGGSLQPGAGFIATGKPVIDCTVGTGGATVNLLNVGGYNGPVHTKFSNQVTCIPPQPAQYEKLYSGITLLSTRSLGLPGNMLDSWTFAPTAMSGSNAFAQMIAGSYAGANRPTFTFTGDEDTGIGHGTSNAVTIVAGGTDRVTVNNSGLAINSGTMRLKGYTVSGLSALTPVEGDTAYVTDATAPTYLGALTGGGSVRCPVIYNGSAWVSH